MGHKGNAYTDRIWKPERNRPLGRPSRTWEDNIKMDLEEKGWEGEECIHLAWDRDMVMKLYVQYNAEKVLTR
jgi:hypothetical protein